MQIAPSTLTTKIWIFAGIVLAIAAAAFALSREREIQPETAIAARTTVREEVIVTGKTVAEEQVVLAFESSGRVARVTAAVGETVKAGQILVELERSELIPELAEARAAESAERARLAELERGTRPEEINIQKSKLLAAETALNEAKKNLIDKLNDAYTKSDDAIRNKTDQIFSNPNATKPAINLVSLNTPLYSKLETDRYLVTSLLAAWHVSLLKLTPQDDLSAAILTAEKNLAFLKAFLDTAALLVSDGVPGAITTQAIFDAYSSGISAARANVSAAATNLTAASGKVKTEEANISVAASELSLKLAGATAEELSAQRAKLAQTVARMSIVEAKIAKTILRAPFSGIVTTQDAKVGEIIAANKSLVTLLSHSGFKIETNVPEVDIAKIKIGDAALITLDAYGNSVSFGARVSSVDPAEIIIEGVATYKVTLQFFERDSRFKSGMTTNIEITTNKRENVIAIPQRAVIAENGAKIVRVAVHGTIQKVPVETGLRGARGEIEIIQGISEGDRVVIFIDSGQ